MSRRVLVVDDVETNRVLLSRRLQRMGFEVSLASDGREALALLAAEPIDVAILDLMMPDMSGLELLRQIRTQRSLVELPVIMASAKSDESFVLEALEAGANDYVVKPINFRLMIGRLEVQMRVRATTTAATRLDSGELRVARVASSPGLQAIDRDAAAASQEPAVDGRLQREARVGVWFGRMAAPASGDELDVLVVHADDVDEALLARRDRPRLLAHLSVGEVRATSPHFEELRRLGAQLELDDEGSAAIADLSSLRWCARLLDGHLGMLRERGFDGVVLDTLDVALNPARRGGTSQRSGLRALLEALRARWPDALLLGCHAQPVPEFLFAQLDAIVLDSLASSFELSRASRRPALRASLRPVRVAHGRPMLALDYR